MDVCAGDVFFFFFDCGKAGGDFLGGRHESAGYESADGRPRDRRAPRQQSARLKPLDVFAFLLQVVSNASVHEARVSSGPWKRMAADHPLVARVWRVSTAMVGST